jgi:hypothetical protein
VVFSERSGGAFSFQHTLKFLPQSQNTAILFTNILGQLLLKRPNEAEFQYWWKQVETKLAGFSWASYHDLYSTVIPRRAQPSHLPSDLDESLKIASRTISDHGTRNLIPFKDWCAWNLSRSQLHWIGFFNQRR